MLDVQSMKVRLLLLDPKLLKVKFMMNINQFSLITILIICATILGVFGVSGWGLLFFAAFIIWLDRS